MDRGAWWATVHGVVKSRTGLKWLAWIHAGNGEPRGFLNIESHDSLRFVWRIGDQVKELQWLRRERI